MSAIILVNEWAIIGLRFAAAAYLGWVAFKSAKDALQSQPAGIAPSNRKSSGSYTRGLLIHLTNPKAILFFGALYAFGLPVGAGTEAVLLIAGAAALQSILIFVWLALQFSHRWIADGYWRFRRAFECVFAAAFGFAAANFLMSAVQSLFVRLPRIPD